MKSFEDKYSKYKITGSRDPRRFYKEFKVHYFFIGKSKSIKLILKSFENKYSLILVIFILFVCFNHFFN